MKTESTENLYKPFSQLCWDCKRTLDCSCEWSLALKPVKGWEAIKDKTENKKTYMIFKCPKFIPIKPARTKSCLCCGNDFQSFADNVFCSAKCYISYTPNYIERECKECGKKFITQATDKEYCTKCMVLKRRKGDYK